MMLIILVIHERGDLVCFYLSFDLFCLFIVSSISIKCSRTEHIFFSFGDKG